jgi:hypothetical protein
MLACPGGGHPIVVTDGPEDAEASFRWAAEVGHAKRGIFLSVDAGKVFHPIGLAGVTVGSLAVNGSGTRLFATTYGSGIYVSPMPATMQLQ